MEQYHILGRVGEGAHGVVLKAKHLKVRVQLPDLVGSIKSHLCKPRVVMICTFDNVCISHMYLIKQTGELVALKKVPLRKLEDGIPNSALRCSKN